MLFPGKKELFFAIVRRTADKIGKDEAELAFQGSQQELREKCYSRSPGGSSSKSLGTTSSASIGWQLEAAQRSPGMRRADWRSRSAELAARFFFGMLIDKQHLAMSLGSGGHRRGKRSRPPDLRGLNVFLAALCTGFGAARNVQRKHAPNARRRGVVD
jgi:hypothetical protein